MAMILGLIQTTLNRFGLVLERRRSRPFGLNWADDLAYLAGDVKIALDVGANVGQTASRLTSRFPEVHVFSFEPAPATFQKLHDAWAGQGQVTCIQMALGAQAGRAEMTDLPTSDQNTLLVGQHQRGPTVSVEVGTVDTFVAERHISSVDLLKIDTEGYELEVLQGAINMLRSRQIRFVLTECEFTARPEEPHGAFEDISRLLLSLEYRVVAFYSGGVDGEGWRWGDVLWMLPDGNRPVACSPHSNV